MKTHYELVEVQWRRLYKKEESISRRMLEYLYDKDDSFFLAGEFGKRVNVDDFVIEGKDSFVFTEDIHYVTIRSIGNDWSVTEDRISERGSDFIFSNQKIRNCILDIYKSSDQVDGTRMGQAVLVFKVVCDEFYTDEGWPEFDYDYYFEGVWDESVKPAIKGIKDEITI